MDFYGNMLLLSLSIEKLISEKEKLEESNKHDSKFSEEIRLLDEKILNKKKECYDYFTKVIACSRFNKNDFGNVLSILMQAVEGCECGFEFDEDISDNALQTNDLNYFILDNSSDSVHDSRLQAIKITTQSILNDEHDVSEDNLNIFKRFMNIFKGDMFIIYYNDRDKDSLEFNAYDMSETTFEEWNKNGCFEPFMTCKIGNFDYLNDFIDYVIEYRVNNNIREVSYTELLKLASEYLKTLSPDKEISLIK